MTMCGYLGLAAKTARFAGSIVVILGGMVPYILRLSQLFGDMASLRSTRYQLVGEALVKQEHSKRAVETLGILIHIPQIYLRNHGWRSHT